MEPKEKRHISSVDSKVVLIVVIFSVCVCCMVGVTYLAVNTLSAAKSYTTLKDNWWIIRDNSVRDLKHYVETGNSADYISFKKNITILENLETVRRELLKPHFNNSFVANALEAGQVNDHEVPAMIHLFRRTHDVSLIKRIIIIWGNADKSIAKLDSLGNVIHNDLQLGNTDQATISGYLVRIDRLNSGLDAVHYRISTAMDVAARWIKNRLLYITFGIAFVLLFIGGMSTTAVLFNSRSMRETIEDNEQRFRSFFDHNPNAVFIKDLEGRILNSNTVASSLTGYSTEDLKGMKLNQFVIPEHHALLKDNFTIAASGIPHRVEVDCTAPNGRSFTIALTDVPIFVNGKCTGVFGVAENITDRKELEKKIHDSLGEKEILMAEIHHRVKNNLALISGLLDLQQQYSGKPELSGVLSDARRRVHSMAKIHELLYQETSFSQIEFKSYIYNLSKNMASTFTNEIGSIHLNIKAETLYLNINKAIPLGLILNELITNAYKHSFKNSAGGTIFIELRREKELFTLAVLTDGARLPNDFNAEDHKTLGMTLIRMLSLQINGQFEVVHGKYDGFQIRFTPETIS